MDVCPMHAADQNGSFPLRPIISTRYTTVSPGSAVAETTAGVLYQVSKPVQLGAHVPVVLVSDGEDTTSGLGNMVVFASGAILPAPGKAVLNLGLQLELPTVTDPKLGDGHFLMLPTLQAGWHPGNAIVMATVGWGQVLDGGHSHGGTDHAHGEHSHSRSESEQPATSIVNPHANSEILVRLDLGAHLPVAERRLRLTLRMDGIQEIDSEDTANQIINIGPAIGLLGNRLTTELYTLVPLSNTRRYTNQTGLRLRIQLP
jgi:hypothetical protein